MDVERLHEALKDFEKKGKKEVCSLLDQFLCHVAKTGETFTPFTIQRLCELLTDPRRNYTDTEKFLRGVEKNVMVVSCIYPSSEKSNTNLNRMNGDMFPNNSQNYTDRSNVNGPGTPRPVGRSKLSLSSPMTTNGLPDSTENKGSDLPQKEEDYSDSPSSDEESPSSTVKTKRAGDDPGETQGHEVKRLKFETDDEDTSDSHQTSHDESSTDMSEEAECVSTSVEDEEEEEKEGCEAEQALDEEALMTASESSTEDESEKDANDNITVTEETTEESHQMEESEPSDAARDLHAEAQVNVTSSSAASDSHVAEHVGSLGTESPEVSSESTMENGDEATEAAEEPMEQD
ncbi:serine/threonine-protein phosphatase 4 regulatory subunit 2 [Bombina bombina]|uniref:serine/threonine-protein phosphatase 4 regulatory subunit 2 n=1 Tax=Bombina bombina TaxID=8345 RepID=UPI00235A4D86|nr:serine/threonine-protein phosphatase 4 regulatory subunit 2 [Bombina bombina]